MNALAAGHGWRDLAIWVMPSALYALASDTLIGVVRAWVLARARDLGETLAEDGPTPLSMAGAAALWLLRLVLAPKSRWPGSGTGWSPTARWRRAFAPGTWPSLKRNGGPPTSRSPRPSASGMTPSGMLPPRLSRPAARRTGRAPPRPRCAASLTGCALTRGRPSPRRWPMPPGNGTNCAAGPNGRPTGCAPSLRRPAPMPRDWWSSVREEAAARIASLEADRAGLREERDRLAADLRAAARQRGPAPARHGAAGRSACGGTGRPSGTG